MPKNIGYAVRNAMPGKKKGVKRGRKRTSKPGPGARERDYRGIDGAVDDAVGNASKSLQERDFAGSQ